MFCVSIYEQDICTNDIRSLLKFVCQNDHVGELLFNIWKSIYNKYYNNINNIVFADFKQNYITIYKFTGLNGDTFFFNDHAMFNLIKNSILRKASPIFLD